MAIEITGKQFNPKTVKRFVQKSFEKQDLVFSDKDPELSKRLKRESGFSSLAHATMFLKSGMKLKLGIKFGIKAGKILPDTKGLIYTAKIDGTTIPLAKPKGEDYDWASWIKKISNFVKKREEKQAKKPPTISKARATDNKIPSTRKAKLEVKRTEVAGKKSELAKQQASLDKENVKNTKLETEIEAFKKTAA